MVLIHVVLLNQSTRSIAYLPFSFSQILSNSGVASGSALAPNKDKNMRWCGWPTDQRCSRSSPQATNYQTTYTAIRP
jgi:hypothetical protein